MTDNDFQVDATEDASAFSDGVLAHYDAVVFLSTTGDPLNDTQQAAFERYIRAGGGYTGIHAAADTEYDVDLVRQAGGRVLPQPPGRARRPRRSTSRTPSTTRRRASRRPGSAWTSGTTTSSPEGAGSAAADTDYSPRDGGVHVLATVDESTYDEDDGNDDR